MINFVRPFSSQISLNHKFKVLIPLGEEKNGIILDDDYSIGYVHNEMNNTDHDIVLHYRILHKQKQTT